MRIFRLLSRILPPEPRPRFVALNQARAHRSWRRPWEYAPRPIQRAALDCWGVIPAPIQHALSPLGDLINPQHTSAVEVMPGPATVPGVAEARAAGFTPIEELTGFAEVALVWPEEHRRAVAETREWWLDEPLEGKLWLVRPPWPG